MRHRRRTCTTGFRHAPLRPLCLHGIRHRVRRYFLGRARLPGGKDWVELPLGRGKILFSALPLELNDRLDSVAAVYAYAIQAAGVTPTYTTAVSDPGLLICPTLLPHATLYVLASETNQTAVSFRDQRSGKSFTGTLEPGHASLLLVGEDGKLITSYRWHGE